MKTLLLATAAALLLACSSTAKNPAPAGNADQAAAEKAATASAESWLGLVDAGKYGESWDASAELFRNALTKEEWDKALQGVRPPLGKVVSRKVSSATYTESVPGGPDGKYVILQFDTSFEQKKSATETVTPMLDKDGTWRVSGYFIK